MGTASSAQGRLSSCNRVSQPATRMRQDPGLRAGAVRWMLHTGLAPFAVGRSGPLCRTPMLSGCSSGRAVRSPDELRRADASWSGGVVPDLVSFQETGSCQRLPCVGRGRPSATDGVKPGRQGQEARKTQANTEQTSK